MKKYIYFLLNIFTVILFLVGASFLKPNYSYAANTDGIGCAGGMGPIAETLCKIFNQDKTTQNTQVANSLNTLVSGIISFMTIVAGLWFFIQFIIGGFQWISAGADKSLLEFARLRMLHAVIGLLIVVGSYILVGLIGNIFGLNIFNPGEAIIHLVI